MNENENESTDMSSWPEKNSALQKPTPTQQTVTKSQMEAILSEKPVYANKFFISVEDNMVRMTFADEIKGENLTAVRASVMVTIPGFMALMQVANQQAVRIQEAVNKQQTARFG